ncbi:hypothetical protein R3P38DRAFT_3230877 [Favolaschia claudopus]|uniref:Chromo domain-containing protein n=1 Tax=Favolaschia claudopus TaxID=2862362 RepID=A0AAV9ZLT1_9AGAR
MRRSRRGKKSRKLPTPSSSDERHESEEVDETDEDDTDPNEAYSVEQILRARTRATKHGTTQWEYETKWENHEGSSWTLECDFNGHELIRAFWFRADVASDELRRGGDTALKYKLNKIISPDPARLALPLPAFEHPANANGTRVFAPWNGTDIYYPGIVASGNASQGYTVHFDDGDIGVVALEDLRTQEIRPGDIINLEDAVAVSAVTADGTIQFTLPTRVLTITKHNIDVHWDDRRLQANDIICGATRKS